MASETPCDQDINCGKTYNRTKTCYQLNSGVKVTDLKSGWESLQASLATDSSKCTSDTIVYDESGNALGTSPETTLKCNDCPVTYEYAYGTSAWATGAVPSGDACGTAAAQRNCNMCTVGVGKNCRGTCSNKTGVDCYVQYPAGTPCPCDEASSSMPSGMRYGMQPNMQQHPGYFTRRNMM